MKAVAGKRAPGRDSIRRRGRLAGAVVVIVLMSACTGGATSATPEPRQIPTATMQTAATTMAATSNNPAAAPPTPPPTSRVGSSTQAAAGSATGSAPGTRSTDPGEVSSGELPGGGRVMFPGRRLVALYGHPQIAGLGVLGQHDLAGSIALAKDLAGQYQPLSDVPVIPAFEIIASYADAVPGQDGDYSAESSVASLRPWVTAAGAAGMYVVLDLQPGRADFLSQAKRYTDLLTLPFVGLALDPEWRLGPSQLPLQQIGGVDASEVNSVIDWLAGLTTAHGLPQKLLVLHQFRLSMLRDQDEINTDNPNVAVLIHMDGLGTQDVKDETWAAVAKAAGPGTPLGWKNFYTKDTPMLTPAQTMSKKPTPLMISYQ